MSNHKNSGGNQMSLNKSATRRLSLLTGSSLVAASLSVAVFTGVSLAPTAAYAYDECVPTPAMGTLTDGVNGVSDPTLNGAAADTFTCATSPYNGGITYNSAGNLNFTKAGNVAITVGGAGINLAATGADSINWAITGTTTLGGAITGAAGVLGPLIDLTSQSGSITITNKLVNASQAGMTHGIRATSTGGGNISLLKFAQSTNNNVVGGLAALEAVTNGGNIVITDGSVQGYEKGIIARTQDAGSVTITASGVSVSGTGGVAGVDVISGTGGISLSGGSYSGGAGTGILATSTGSITVNISAAGGTARGLDLAAGGDINVTLTGATGGSGGAIVANSGGALNFTFNSNNSSIQLNGGTGAFLVGTSTAGATIANAGIIGGSTGGGRIDLSGVTGGGLTFTNTGAWRASGASVFTAANDTLSMPGTGLSELLSGSSVNFGTGVDTFNLSGRLMATNASLDFGAGADVMNMSGQMTVVGGLALSNLEAFNNSGVIFMGGQGGASTNRVVGDVLTMNSGVFTGSGDSRIVMDISFAGAMQTDCSAAAAADCVDLTGASTAGTTLLTIVNVDGTTTSGSSSTTTLIVGSSAADDFALDPDSDGYVLTDQGGALRFRLFDMFLLYDAEAQAHSLAAVPHVEAFQGTSFGSAAQDIWRATAGSWFDRQADLRSTPGGLERSRGLWARGGVSVTNRDAVLPLTLLGSSFDQDVNYRQRTSHAVFGADFMGGVSGDNAWVMGASAGLVRSDSEFDSSSTEAIYAGFAAGLYVSLLFGPWFIDGSVNTNVLDAEVDMPSLQLDDQVALTQKLTSVGAQLQSGWRFAMGQSVFVEPLVSVAYVQTKLDDIEVPGDAGTIEFDDATSLRAGLGVRVGADTELLGQSAGFSLTARHWNEFEGENGVSLAGNAPVLLVDDYSGSVSELAAGFSMQTSNGAASAFLNFGSKFGEGYRSVDGAIGVRMRW